VKLIRGAKVLRPKTFDAAYDGAEDTDFFAPGTWNGDVRSLELTGELSADEYAAVSKAKDSHGQKP